MMEKKELPEACRTCLHYEKGCNGFRAGITLRPDQCAGHQKKTEEGKGDGKDN